VLRQIGRRACVRASFGLLPCSWGRRVSASLCCHAVRLQHGYCTATQAGQFTSHCLVLKNCKMSRCRNTTLVTSWRLEAANDRFGGTRQTECEVVHAGVWRVGRLVPFIIHLGVKLWLVASLTFRSPYPRQRSPRCSLNRGLVGSESCVGVLERIKCAAFARNPRCRGGAEVNLHEYCFSVIDRCGWPIIAAQKCVCTPAVTVPWTARRPHLFFRWESKSGRRAGQTLVLG